MKVILYMAISANGMIAKNDDNTNWISKIEWNSYSTAVKKAGCLVTGHRTYDILTRQEEFSELKEIRLIVVSKKNFLHWLHTIVLLIHQKKLWKSLMAFQQSLWPEEACSILHLLSKIW